MAHTVLTAESFPCRNSQFDRILLKRLYCVFSHLLQCCSFVKNYLKETYRPVCVYYKNKKKRDQKAVISISVAFTRSNLLTRKTLENNGNFKSKFSKICCSPFFLWLRTIDCGF